MTLTRTFLHFFIFINTLFNVYEAVSSRGLWLLSTRWVISGFTLLFGNIWSPGPPPPHTHRESAAVFRPHITWLSVPENPSRHVLTSQHGDSFTQTLSGPDATQSGNPSARLCEGVIKRVKTDLKPPEHRECLYYHQTHTHPHTNTCSPKPNQRNAWGGLQSVPLMPKNK